MIKFLRSYSTKGVPPEHFTAGQEVTDRSEASERHFVVRGVAAFMDADGNLTDADHRPVVFVAPSPEAIEAAGGVEEGEILTMDALLGELDASRALVTDLTAKAGDAQSQLEASRKELDAARAELDEAKAALAESNAGVASLQSQLEAANASSAALEKQLGEAKASISELEKSKADAPAEPASKNKA